MHSGPRRDEPLDERADRGLLDVLQHADDDRPAALKHAEDRRRLGPQGPAPPRPFQASVPAFPPLFFTASGCPL